MSDLIPVHLNWCRAQGYARRTVSEREALLWRLHHDLRNGLEYAADVEIADWYARDTWSPATRATYQRHGRGFYTWAADRPGGYLEWNPMEHLPVAKAPYGRPRPLSDAQVVDILTRAREPFRTFMILAVGAGLRCCEISQLSREDITEEEIYLRRAKGGASATVPTGPDIWETVKAFPPGSIPVHLGGRPDERWISIRSALYFRKTLKSPGISLHRGRHTFARRLRDAGADPYVLQEALRHKSVETVRIYAGPRVGECRTAIRTLPAFIAPAAS